MSTHKPPSFRTPSSFVTFRLAKLQGSLNRQATALLKAKTGLTLVEWRLIQILRMFKNASMHEIADLVLMDKGQLSRKIKVMKAKGLLNRERDTKDRRVQHLKLTKKARELSNKMMPTMEARQQLLLAEVAPEDLTTFYQVVDKLELASKVREIE